jgi:phosphatidylglycerophosphatase A
MPSPPASTPLDRLAFLVASAGGAGLSPIAPGTAGTLVALPLYWLLARYTPPEVYVLVSIALLVAGIAAATRVSRALAVTDPGVVVIDEVVGFLVTMTFVAPSAPAIVLGFVVFRLLDIFKPLGIDRLERMPLGLGIMMDDFAAGVLGNIIVRLALELPAVLAGPGRA